MKIQQRSYQAELIDLGPSYYTDQEYEECLYQLGRIGHLLGGNRASLSIFRKLHLNPQSILDVGCGGGFFTMDLAQCFPQAQVLGIDTNSQAIAFAKKRLQDKKPRLTNVSFEIPLTPQLNDSSYQFDVITSTLVCHHLSDYELVEFLKSSYRIAKKAVIINDLHRHSWAYYGFKLISPVLFPNRLIQHDGLLSIQRSFTRKDWVRYLQAADIPLEYCQISWHWAFRWIVAINTSKGFSDDL